MNADGSGREIYARGLRNSVGFDWDPRTKELWFTNNQIFIAEHGSWNRSKKIGYRITLVRVEGNKPVAYEPFATGWLQGEKAWGRPVDVLVMPDGALLVSDDYAGAIYRITYRG